MIRLLFAFALVFLSLGAQENINTKISSASSKLDSFSKNYSNINKMMDENAKAVITQKKELDKKNKYLEELKEELTLKESDYKENVTKLSSLKSDQSELTKEQAKIEEELVFLIAQSVSLSIILEERNSMSAESLIEFEVLSAMLKSSKDKVAQLNEKFFFNANGIDKLNMQTSLLEVEIANIDAARKQVIQTKMENKKALAKLEKDKESYKIKLKEIITQQDSLKRTLAELNIIKIDEIKKEKEEKERQEAFDNENIVLDENLPKVKKHATSYQSVKTKEYKGAKTIAPFDSYDITKKYGTYTDPIYGIKIFNESISLKPKKEDERVKTVFSGKVIYADKTAVLNNIVIVEHTNGLHTIYANLSQISPNIKKGQKIKRGYTIGRVNEELIFEVTQKSYHIDPIQLFK